MKRWMVFISVSSIILLSICSLSIGHGGSYGRHSYGLWGQRGLVSFFIDHKDELELSDGQIARLEAIRDTFMSRTDPIREELKKTHEELGTLLKEDNIDLEKAYVAMEKASDLRLEMGKVFVQAIAEGKGILTMAQLQKAKELREKLRKEHKGKYPRTP